MALPEGEYMKVKTINRRMILYKTQRNVPFNGRIVNEYLFDKKNYSFKIIRCCSIFLLAQHLLDGLLVYFSGLLLHLLLAEVPT